MEIFGLIAQVSQATSPFILALAVWAFATGKVVPRWIHDEALKREAAVWTLYEREKQTSEKLISGLERREKQDS